MTFNSLKSLLDSNSKKKELLLYPFADEENGILKSLRNFPQ